MTPTTRQNLANMPGIVNMVELGVAAGKFAELLLDANPKLHYIGVDRWADHHDEAERIRAGDRLAKFRGRAILVQSTFEDALPFFDDGCCDMVYVDGYAHTGQEEGKTLFDWWPKVRSGGIFAGHDYDAYYPQTVRAVNAFVETLRAAGEAIELHVIEERPNCSWWVRKH